MKEVYWGNFHGVFFIAVCDVHTTELKNLHCFLCHRRLCRLSVCKILELYHFGAEPPKNFCKLLIAEIDKDLLHRDKMLCWRCEVEPWVKSLGIF